MRVGYLSRPPVTVRSPADRVRSRLCIAPPLHSSHFGAWIGCCVFLVSLVQLLNIHHAWSTASFQSSVQASFYTLNRWCNVNFQVHYTEKREGLTVTIKHMNWWRNILLSLITVRDKCWCLKMQVNLEFRVPILFPEFFILYLSPIFSKGALLFAPPRQFLFHGFSLLFDLCNKDRI